MDLEKIHIGKLVKSIVRQNNIKDADFARKIGKSRQNVYDMYKRTDFEVKLLLTCSLALDHNFFEDIYPKSLSEEEIIDKVFETFKGMIKERIKNN